MTENAPAYIQLPYPTDDVGVVLGQRVECYSAHPERNGRKGTVVGWARSQQAHGHYLQHHDPDVLIENEGVLVEWGEPHSGDLEWFAGQSMGALVPFD